MHRPFRPHSLDWPPYPPTAQPTSCPRAPPTSVPLSVSHPHPPHSPSLPHPLRERRARTSAGSTRGVASALAVPPAPRGRNVRLPHSDTDQDDEDGAELSESDTDHKVRGPNDPPIQSRNANDHISRGNVHGHSALNRPRHVSNPNSRHSSYEPETYHTNSSSSSLLVNLEEPLVPAFSLKPPLAHTFPRFRARLGRGQGETQTPPITPPADCASPDVLAAVARLEDTVAALRLELDAAREEIAELRAQVARA